MAIPVVTLAASGHDLPALPPYEYEPLNGDATGFYAEARELISAAFGPAGAAAALIVAVGGWAAWRLRPRWTAIAVAALTVSLAASALVLATEPAGAAVVGWPLLWAIPLLPLRVVGVLDPDVAFAVGFADLARRERGHRRRDRATRAVSATGRRGVGLAAAALFALWPLLTRPLAGPSAWENGQWNVDVGLHLYTEPLSTALVAVALALLLAPRLDELRLALVGARARLRDRGQGLERPLRGGGRRARRLSGSARARLLPLAAAGAAFAPLVARLLAEGLPRRSRRSRLLARSGGPELGGLAPLRPADAARAAARSRCSALLALRPWRRSPARRLDRHERRLLHASTSTRTSTRASSTRRCRRSSCSSPPEGWLVIRKGSGK